MVMSRKQKMANDSHLKKVIHRNIKCKIIFYGVATGSWTQTKSSTSFCATATP